MHEKKMNGLLLFVLMCFCLELNNVAAQRLKTVYGRQRNGFDYQNDQLQEQTAFGRGGQQGIMEPTNETASERERRGETISDRSSYHGSSICY